MHPFGRRRMRGAHPAAPDGNEKNSKWQQQWYVSAEINAFCSFGDCLQTPRSTHSQIKPKVVLNLWKIEPGTAKIQPDSSLQHSINAKSMQEAPKDNILMIWEVHFGESLDFSENSSSISITFLHADFYWFSVVLGSQNVSKVNTFFKSVWKAN